MNVAGRERQGGTNAQDDKGSRPLVEPGPQPAEHHGGKNGQEEVDRCAEEHEECGRNPIERLDLGVLLLKKQGAEARRNYDSQGSVDDQPGGDESACAAVNACGRRACDHTDHDHIQPDEALLEAGRHRTGQCVVHNAAPEGRAGSPRAAYGGATFVLANLDPEDDHGCDQCNRERGGPRHGDCHERPARGCHQPHDDRSYHRQTDAPDAQIRDDAPEPPCRGQGNQEQCSGRKEPAGKGDGTHHVAGVCVATPCQRGGQDCDADGADRAAERCHEEHRAERASDLIRIVHDKTWHDPHRCRVHPGAGQAQHDREDGYSLQDDSRTDVTESACKNDGQDESHDRAGC